MERTVTNATAPAQVLELTRGVVRQLKHLSAGTDIPSTHLVAAHNGAGYGYIGTPEGNVFFDSSAVTDVRFDQLKRGMTLEFVLDQAPYLRTSRVTIVANVPGESGRSDAQT